jgi:hypothetical protein
VHLVGAGGLGEHLRQLLRGGVDGWRLHELPVTQTPLNDAGPLLGPRVYAMLARYGFTTVEQSQVGDGGDLLSARPRAAAPRAGVNPRREITTEAGGLRGARRSSGAAQDEMNLRMMPAISAGSVL